MSNLVRYEEEDIGMTVPHLGAAKASTEEQGKANALAELAERVADAAVRKGFSKGIEAGMEQVEAIASQRIASLSERVADAEQRINKAIELVGSTKTVRMVVQVGNLEPVALQGRPAKMLARTIAQVRVGQAGGNWPMVFGPTGCGKSVLAEQVADSLGKPIACYNGGLGISEADLFGKTCPVRGIQPGAAWLAYRDGHGLFLDEVDGFDPNVMVSINALVASRRMTNPKSGEGAERHPDFFVIAASNTNGKGASSQYSGRVRLDAAFLNRFDMIAVDYDTDLERELCADKRLLAALWSIRVGLVAKKSGDVVSTRDIQNASMKLCAGLTAQEVFDSFRLRFDASNLDLVNAAQAEYVDGVQK